MNGVVVFEYLMGISAVIAALYVALSRNLLRVTVAFFLELAAISGILLSLNAEYLALVVFAIGVLGTALIASFSGVIMGNLKEGFGKMAWKPAQILGMGLGLVMGVVMGVMLLGDSFMNVVKGSSADFSFNPLFDEGLDGTRVSGIGAKMIGDKLLGDQLAVFELLSVLVLVVIIGAALLLRKPKDAN